MAVSIKLSAERQRMENLQERRADAAARRRLPAFAPALAECVSKRSFGFVSFAKGQTIESGTHIGLYLSADYLRKVHRIVEAVTAAIRTQGNIFSVAPPTDGARSLLLKKSAASDALLDALNASFRDIRLQFPASAFHPYFDLVDWVLGNCGHPEIKLSSSRISEEQCTRLNELVDVLRHVAPMLSVARDPTEAGNLDQASDPPLLHRGLQLTHDDERRRLWEAVRKSRSDLDKFLHFLPHDDVGYRLQCFTATRIDSDAYKAERECLRWNLNNFAAELKAFNGHRNSFMRALKIALGAEVAAEKARVIGKIEHCLRGGLRLFVIVILPPTSKLTNDALHDLMRDLWRRSSRTPSSLAPLALGVDRFALTKTKSRASLRERVLDRVVSVDALVRLDVAWLAKHSQVRLSPRIKTISRFAA